VIGLSSNSKTTLEKTRIEQVQKREKRISKRQ